MDYSVLHSRVANPQNAEVEMRTLILPLTSGLFSALHFFFGRSRPIAKSSCTQPRELINDGQRRRNSREAALAAELREGCSDDFPPRIGVL